MSTTVGHCQKSGLMETSPVFGLGHLKMVILGFLVAVIAGIGVWYWRFKMLHEASSEVIDLVGRARGAYRMRKFRKQAEGSALNGIDDPALAAAVLLFALANENRASAHKGGPEIRARLAPVVPAGDLDELLSYAEWAARDVVDPRDLVRRFRTLWREKLTPDERGELIEMAEAVTALSDPAEPGQVLAIEALRAAVQP